MKSALVLVRALLFVAGLTLVSWGLLPNTTTMVGAAPPLLVTETGTAEPSTPTNTAVPITPTPGELTPEPPTNTPVVPPTDTPVPTTPPPSVTPGPTDPPPSDDRPRSTPTPTATPLPPTATPMMTPTAIPPAPADPAITKSVNPGSAKVGDTVEYTINVTNLGGSVATGVVVDDSLPSFLTPTGVTTSRGDATISGQSVRVTIGDLAPGETVTIRITARVNAQATPPNNANLATVSSTSPDGNPDNNRASVPLNPLPVTLPVTGDESGPLALAALILGLVLIGASLLVRRRAI